MGVNDPQPRQVTIRHLVVDGLRAEQAPALERELRASLGAAGATREDVEAAVRAAVAGAAREGGAR